MIAQNLVGKTQKVGLPKDLGANKLGGLNTKLGGPMPGRPTHSAATG